jgi:hypothetical protein
VANIKKVVGIGCGSVVGLVVLAILVFWVGWLRAPSAEDVCKHVQEIAVKEVKAKTGTDVPADQVLNYEECVKENEIGENEGLIPYAAKMKCYLDGETMAELEACEKAE